MCSSPEYAAVISKTLEQRKPPMLSQPALETLAVVAYFQPVTRAYIDQVRGVDSSYTVGVLIVLSIIVCLLGNILCALSAQRDRHDIIGLGHGILR